MWNTGFVWHENFRQLASRVFRRTLDLLAKWAERYRLFILAGSIAEVTPLGVFNTAYFANPAGEVVRAYRKRNLFHLTGEEKIFLPGDEEATPLETPWGKAGVLICFDLRFPMDFQNLRKKGARLIILPAQFPNPREQHWLTLLQARAIDTQCFVLGCNRVGADSPATSYFGSSCIVSPWGEVLLQGRTRETLVATELDLSLVERTRRELPFWRE
jgi:omega-amidase